jgi:hypothetical protein
MLEPGIVFFAGLLLLVCLFLRRVTKIETLEQHGLRVVATVTGIEPHAMFTRVTAYWQHPQTRQVYHCHNWMLFNPLPLQPGRQVQVLVDPANYRRYAMQAAL